MTNEATQASYRTIGRRVTFRVALTGQSVIYQRSKDEHRILVESVRLEFDQGNDGYLVSAYLQGPYLLRNGKPSKGCIESSAGFAFEMWPAWLQALADEHRPEQYQEHRGLVRMLGA